MDPLSIGSAVVGIIAASTRMAPILQHLIAETRDASKTASQVLDEVNSISAALTQLQLYLIGAVDSDVARRSLVSLNNLVATLTACVTTYSDLERIVGNCSSRGRVNKLKWIYYEGEVAKLLQRVQLHKSSLMLMLNILQCEAMHEAQTTMRRLVALVDTLVGDDPILKARLDKLTAGPSWTEQRTSPMSSMNSVAYRTYEEVLQKSRVYRRNIRAREIDSIYSYGTSQLASLALSRFSDLSFGNISTISVFCLPIWSEDLSNATHYRFGREGLEQTLAELTEKYPGTDPLGLVTVDDTSVHGNSEKILLYDMMYRTSAGMLFIAASTVVGGPVHGYIQSVPPDEEDTPFLSYVAREVFEVLDVKGELWLARKREGPFDEVGWVQHKNFEILAKRVLVDEKTVGNRWRAYKSYPPHEIQARKHDIVEIKALRDQIEHLRQKTPRHPAIVKSSMPDRSTVVPQVSYLPTGTAMIETENSPPPTTGIWKRYDTPREEDLTLLNEEHFRALDRFRDSIIG